MIVDSIPTKEFPPSSIRSSGIKFNPISSTTALEFVGETVLRQQNLLQKQNHLLLTDGLLLLKKLMA
jgi:hypothetical protein